MAAPRESLARAGQAHRAGRPGPTSPGHVPFGSHADRDASSERAWTRGPASKPAPAARRRSGPQRDLHRKRRRAPRVGPPLDPSPHRAARGGRRMPCRLSAVGRCLARRGERTRGRDTTRPARQLPASSIPTDPECRGRGRGESRSRDRQFSHVVLGLLRRCLPAVLLIHTMRHPRRVNGEPRQGRIAKGWDAGADASRIPGCDLRSLDQ